MIGAALLLAVALPRVQQVAPGVWAAGFSDRRASATGG